GVVLTWGLALLLAPTHPFLAGWVGMVGLIFVLHFGAFHLLSLAWRRLGVRAEPLMRAPVLATSLAEFWGRRWNAAFHELVHRYTFRPLVRAWGTRGATLLVFLVSGLIHELVISVPARGGFGGPTAYFLVNGAGLLLEHSRTGRRWGLGAGWRGRAFALVTVAAPVGLLCHPPFVHHVILPFLHAIGAT
ncbi:MAG TPA: MBOAT family protein, partial [Lacunisphaera sp.]|nr:MBOAT family protein [Lacunisphaera sp.]